MLLSRVKCLTYGHEDRVRSDEHRMYLECVECGRHTTGWQLRNSSAEYQPPRPAQAVIEAA